MGQSIIRLGDPSTGHGAWGPNTQVQASSNVFVNGIGAVRDGDSYKPHKGPSTHPETAKSGATVFVNGRAVHRTGDPCSCGDTAGQGSQNVFAG